MRQASLVIPVFVVVLLGPVVLGHTGPIAAQDATAPPGGQGLVGSWRLTVTEDQAPSFFALGTFAADGTVVVSPPPVVPPSPHGPGTVVHTSAGHGAWEATGPDTAILTFVLQSADGEGHPFGTRTVRARVTLGADGQAFSGEYVGTVADSAGTPMATDSGTIQATRIVAEAPEMPNAAMPAA